MMKHIPAGAFSSVPMTISRSRSGQHLPAKRLRPEPGQPWQVAGVNDDVMELDRHAASMRGHAGQHQAPRLTRGAGRDRHSVLPPLWVRARLAVLSEPGSVQTMRSLAACSPALKVARGMTDPGMDYPCGTDTERHPGQTPDASRRALCVYCRTDRFVYWPSAIRLSLAECPGCQRQGPEIGRAHV